MSSNYDPTDTRFFRELWYATKPETGEHRLSFTVKLTTFGSASLRNKGSGFITAALKLVSGLLHDESPIDIVVVVERNKKATQTLTGKVVNLHIHGWLRISDSVSAAAIQKQMNDRAKKKYNKSIWRNGGWLFRDMNPKTNKPVDIGWPRYSDKDFNRWPTGCISASHHYSATKSAKSRARVKGHQRHRNFRKVQKYFANVDRQIQRAEGDWKYWRLGYTRIYK